MAITQRLCAKEASRTPKVAPSSQFNYLPRARVKSRTTLSLYPQACVQALLFACGKAPYRYQCGVDCGIVI